MAYAPVIAENLSSSNQFSHYDQVYKVKRFLKTLRPNTVFAGVCQKATIPKGGGALVEWHRKTNLSANTTSQAEGIVGTGIAIAPTKNVQAAPAQYADYATVSDMHIAKYGDGWWMEAQDDLSFRASLTLDNLTRANIDTYTGAAGTLLATYLTSKQFSSMSAILEGQNVRGFDGTDTFKAFTHPYTAFDIENDPTAGSLQDLNKYTRPDTMGAGLKKEWRGFVGNVGGVDIFKSTNVLLTAGTPNQWRTYLFGDEAFGCSSFAGFEPTMVEDPATQKFKISTWKSEGASLANPTGQIAGGVSYNFAYVGGVALSGPATVGGIFKHSYVDSPSSIVA